MGYVLLGHRGSGDHGCEDYVRGLCSMLPEPPTVFSHCPREDWHYGICRLAAVCRQTSREEFTQLQKGDWSFQTKAARVGQLRRRGVRPVVFACGNPARAQLRLLGDYELVAVTEAESYAKLQKAGLENLILSPDPAFLVPVEEVPPFAEDTVGLCLSYPQAAGQLLLWNYQRLIEYILSATAWQMVLIPYCVKPRSNDLLLHRALYRQYRDTGRIRLGLDGDARQLRAQLARCRLCVGCGGAVAAWSCGVPALCLHATGRTMGLSRTLFGSCQAGVLPWQLFREETDLAMCFREFLRREDRCRQSLERNIYRLQAGIG